MRHSEVLILSSTNADYTTPLAASQLPDTGTRGYDENEHRGHYPFE
jgi:hypothetical protein